MFIAFLYMFRANMCPSQGENTVPMRRLVFVTVYRVSQEECARLRESVPYVKVYRYNRYVQIFVICLLLFSTCFGQLCAHHKEEIPYLCDVWYLSLYTGCPRRNVPDFGRVFLMLKYTDITQNTYIQS